MTRILIRILPLLIIASLIGCKKSEAPDQQPSGVILKLGKGAVMVSFPQTENFSRENWLAMVNLTGPHKTHLLPRVTMADLQTMVVLDIEPGTYSVSAQAWLRKQPPSAGGMMDSIEVQAGKVTLLQAQKLPEFRTPEPTVPLKYAGKRTWTLQSGDQMHEYVAELRRLTEKG